MSNDFTISSQQINNRLVFSIADKTRVLTDSQVSVSVIALDKSSLGKRVISYVMEKFLTLFDWKYVKIANSDKLVNINSIVQKLGITPAQAKNYAQLGTLESACRGVVLARAIQSRSSYLEDLEKIFTEINLQSVKDALGRFIKNDATKISFYFEPNSEEFYLPHGVSPQFSSASGVDVRGTADLRHTFKFSATVSVKKGVYFFLDIKNAKIEMAVRPWGGVQFDVEQVRTKVIDALMRT